jgi:hypothetical protein
MKTPQVGEIFAYCDGRHNPVDADIIFIITHINRINTDYSIELKAEVLILALSPGYQNCFRCREGEITSWILEWKEYSNYSSFEYIDGRRRRSLTRLT